MYKTIQRLITATAVWTAAWLLTACVADVADVTDDSGNGKLACGEYVSLRIVNSSNGNNDGSSVTRTATAQENAIYDGILCEFEGVAALSATLKTAVVIDQLINNPGTSATVSVTQRLASGTHPYYNAGTKRYILALLNTTSTGFAVSGDRLYFHGTELTGKTIGDIQSIVIDNIGSAERHVGFYMANTKKSDENILRNLDDDYLYDTPAEAAAGASRLVIDVARAAARVSVSNQISTTLSAIGINGDDSSHPAVNSMTWAPDNYYTATYALDGGSGTRDVSSVATSIFSDTRQGTYASGDMAYMAEGQTDILVELQLKDGAFLYPQLYGYDGVTNQVFTSIAAVQSYIGSSYDTSKLTFYPEGKMYYTFPSISLSRNNAYTLNLTNASITAVGSATPK